jgi:MYXO-CTERM domain-containing protein
MKALLRASLASVLGSAALFVAPVALAAGEPCINDTDCPGAECGGEVCNWNKPQGEKFTCNPAGTTPPQGTSPKDGWCTTVDNCKCKAQGALCGATAPYCSFTQPPAGTGGTSSGGTPATTAGTAATTAGTGTTPTAGTSSGGTGAKPPASDDGGGCSLSVPGGTNTGLALGVGLVGLGLAFARRRR